ncbi:hypothetical protein [Acidisoma cladoniae]|uniref:hypothetical protein n=1 Tax=Acidisoma cladoniae TaxID=3040935 RepID=UPI00254C8940|nr:hypothetical protein [Acidisoma sp. PAMC 29798]
MAEKKSKFAALADLHRAEPDILEETVTPPAPIEPKPVAVVHEAPTIVEPPAAQVTITPTATPRPARAAQAAPSTPVVEEYPRRGRPPTGKRSNPEWRLYSHYLKRQTQRAAVAKLQALDDGQDLSDVIEELLQTWIKK